LAAFGGFRTNKADHHIGGGGACGVDGLIQMRWHFSQHLEENVKTITQATLRAPSMTATLIGAGLAIISFVTDSLAKPVVSPADMNSGSLLLKAEKNGYLEAPRLASDYDVTISGATGRTIVTQRFQNPANGWVEGVYVFPLPDGAAVDSLRIVAGDRVIVGSVKERQEAKIIYEEAKANGQIAALVEQERPNLFTNSVANIGPYETIVVQIEYQEAIKISGGTATLRVPLVVAPRYTPEPVVQSVEFENNGGGFGTSVNQPPPQPPVLDPHKHDKINPVSISITLNAGFTLGNVKSHYHLVSSKTESASSRKITLSEGDVPADKDFELTWTAAGAAPEVGLFSETINGKDYLLGLITPPSVADVAPPRPREMIFVIDNSGSMEGPSMAQAKESLLYGLSRLKPGDRFNVIRFDDTMTMLFDNAVAADMEHVVTAKRFVEGLGANGGTEMVPALKAALADDGLSRATHLRQVVLLTDGAIGNEQEFFSVIGSEKGRSRIFMVGIGSAPNSYLMTRGAEIGQGTFTHIGDGAQVTDRMQELFSKLGQPVVTDLAATFDGGAVSLTPGTLPDLYRGEPVVLMAEATGLKGNLKVTGKIGETPWEFSVPVTQAAKGKGISKLWAARKIADFEVKSILGEMPIEAAQKGVLAVALEHQIVSSQTSLIAVDKTPKRPPGAKLSRADIPLNLPAGWSFEKVFGHEKPPVLERDAALQEFKQLAVLKQPAQANAAAQQVMLPQGATPRELLMWFAALLAMMAMGLRALAQRQLKV
jgi:Ca-activated chloride channel homolog